MSNAGLWQGLLANLAAVVLLSMVYVLLSPRISQLSNLQRSFTVGVGLGIGAIGVMTMPFVSPSGAHLDHRFTVIGISTLFGGPLAGLLTSGLAGFYRCYLGGPSWHLGLVGIAVSYCVGVVAHYRSGRTVTSVSQVVLFSVALPLMVLLSLLAGLPATRMRSGLEPTVAFVTTIFLTTLVCGLAILQEETRRRATRSNAVYKAIIDALPDCLYVKDLHGRFIAANPATATLMGAPAASDLIGRTDFDFYDKETAKAFRRDELDVIDTETATMIDQRIQRTDGSTKFLSTLKAPLWGEGGELLGIITHNRDVSEKRLLEDDLYRVRQTLDDAITNMNDGLAVYDRSGILLFCNEQYRRHFPLTADLRIPGASLADIMAASIARGERSGDTDRNEAWVKGISGERFARQEDRMETSDGRWLHVRTVSVDKGFLFLVSDVTEQKRAEWESLASAREYQTLFENSAAGLYRSTIDGRMLRANPALARLNGCSCEAELIAMVNDIAREWYVDPERRNEFVALMEEHGRITDFVSEVYRFKTRERIWISETAWTVRDANGKSLYYEGTITEITDRKLAEEELKKANVELHSLSTTDALTALANRRAFDECLVAEVVRSRNTGSPLALMMIDVDQFKRFNDTYGHIKGDECLRLIAQTVSRVPRNYGDKACRYGGEEMAVILPDTDGEMAANLAEHLRSLVCDLSIAHTSSNSGIVTISIGVAVLDRDSGFTKAEELVAAADRALYRAKSTGRNRVIDARAA